MKKLLLLLSGYLVCLSATLVSCKKEKDGPGELYGKWKLTETLQDPGDGSGKYIKVNGEAKYLTIDKSGKFQGNALPDLDNFKVLDSIRMEVTSKTYDKPLVYYYTISEKSLTLNPPCIEGCGYRFIRK